MIIKVEAITEQVCMEVVFVRKILSGLVCLMLVCSQVFGAQLTSITQFRGLERDPGENKISDGAHARFNNVYINDGNIQVVKGKQKLNTTATSDTTFNGWTYYENGAGTVKKIIVRESDEVVSYDVDWTNRTQIQGSLTDEKAHFKQIGDRLYMTSSTDGIYIWDGSSTMSALSGVSAPSSVNFSESTSVIGGMTPGPSAIVGAIPVNGGAAYTLVGGSTCTKIDNLYGYLETYHLKDEATTSGLSGSYFSLIERGDSIYKYKITKYSTTTGLESEPSDADTATLGGNDKLTTILSSPTAYFVSAACSASSAAYASIEMIYSGASTSTSGTLASAPTGLFDTYRIYRTVAYGEDFFLQGEQDTGAYADKTPDEALGDPLDTTIDTISPPSFKYISGFKGALWVAEGTTIRRTHVPVNQITDADTYWRELDKLETGNTKSITGMETAGNNLYVFSDDKVQIISGFGLNSLRFRDFLHNVGAVNQEVIEVTNQGNVIFFDRENGVYEIQVSEQRADELVGSLDQEGDSKVSRISSPYLNDVFQGLDEDIQLSFSDYENSHAYFDNDNDKYHLFIGNYEFIYGTVTKAWSVKTNNPMIGSLYIDSPGAIGKSLVIDDLGFTWNNWKGYSNGVPSGTVTGNPTSSTSTTLTDSGASFYITDDGLAGVWVSVISSSGVKQSRRITSNTGTALTISTAWDTNPDSTYTYYVGAIEVDVKTKQYMQNIPKEYEGTAFTIVNEDPGFSVPVTFEIYKDNNVAYEDKNSTFDLNDGIVNKWVAGARGQWVQWRMISYINNYSDSINPPFNIYGYAFRGTPREED